MNQFKYRETRSTTYGRRAFPVTGPMAWNSLPDFIRDPTSSTDCFRHLLKTSIHVQNIKLKSYLVQKLQWKETDGRTRPIALLCLVTRPVITQCSLARPIWRWRGLMPNCYGGACMQTSSATTLLYGPFLSLEGFVLWNTRDPVRCSDCNHQYKVLPTDALEYINACCRLAQVSSV